MEGNVVLSNRRCQRRNAHSDVLPRSLSNKDTAASETGNSHVLWIYIQDFSSAATDVFVLLRLYADLCYHLFWSKYVHCSPLFLHSFTPNTQICSHAEAMWACPSACHRFCFVFFFFFNVSFWSLGKGENICCSIWVFVNDVKFLKQRSPGELKECCVTWEGRGDEKESSERWLWVACLLTHSLQIHSASHMVRITAAKPYKWIQDGGDLCGGYQCMIFMRLYLSEACLGEIFGFF